MKSISFFYSLFWRTLVVYFLLGIVVLIGAWMIRALGFELPSSEIAATVGFIKLKPTLAYAAFALVLLIAEFGLHVNMVQMIAGQRLNISASSWRKYILGLAILLLALAVLNLVVAATVSVEIWINYKLFGAFGLLAFGINALAIWLSKFD